LADQRRRGIRHDEDMLVIGLGRFGGRLATELMSLGHRVLGVDLDPDPVQLYATQLTKTMRADTTKLEVLEQIGADQFDHVIVGIGNLEASILTSAELKTVGVTDLWAKALSESHARILDKIGVQRVVQPESDAGRRMAHQVTGRMLEYLELDAGFALVETEVPAEFHGKTLMEASIRARYGVTIVCIKPAGQSFTYATPDTLIGAGDLVLVAGDDDDVEAFADAL
jgi:trk system potassium uptake protein TrkA